ncbi:glycine zipper family protein [Geomesophilobacter sediminis]|uniref:Glycine zipper family protein n=1 Tax=Geomesophilobacter sediminis TaxID=2798584 RepID=A0A8J7M0Q7_9BACT|nr:glycine zipper family protein [Geomesophilobacter sediminis]MBJ6726447.1 glycine zipper family protein [Geomesophilobacter sediminis]
MRNARIYIASALLLATGGCATLPSGPSVTVYPARCKSFEAFRTEDATCRQWAERQTQSAQETHDQDVAKGAVTGTAVGAGIGAVLGSAAHNPGAGAVIGAGYGLLVGSLAGANAGASDARVAQRRYDNAYVQCMYSYGNQIPGYRRVARAEPAAAPPPPPPAVAPPPAEADDYAATPEPYFEEAPRFIYSPEMNIYVAVGVPYDLVYTGSEYYYFYGGRWYRGPYYNGPWAYVPRRSYPGVFVSYRVGEIRRYREAEFRRYERDREHYRGRLYRPQYRVSHRHNREEHR